MTSIVARGSPANSLLAAREVLVKQGRQLDGSVMAIFDDLVNEPKKAKVFRRKVVALHEKQDELRSAVAECVQRGVTDLCGSSAVYVRSRERVRVTAAPSPPAAVAAATRTPTKRSRPLGMGVRSAKDAFQATMNKASVHINGLLGKASTAAEERSQATRCVHNACGVGAHGGWSRKAARASQSADTCTDHDFLCAHVRGCRCMCAGVAGGTKTRSPRRQGRPSSGSSAAQASGWARTRRGRPR